MKSCYNYTGYASVWNKLTLYSHEPGKGFKISDSITHNCEIQWTDWARLNNLPELPPLFILLVVLCAERGAKR
jgi:hypothetical protein